MNNTPLLLATILTVFPLLASGHAPQEAGAAPAAGQEKPDDAAVTRDVLARANPEARALWERMMKASRTEASWGVPIKDFILRADVKFRGEGAQRNEGKVGYHYLAPHFIRFILSSQRETGRGPGVGQNGYWLKDKEEVIRLVGRENREDRRLVDEMLVIARNFIALSDTSRIRLTKLELMADPPTALPRTMERLAKKKVDWIRVASPDFALLQDQVGRAGGAASDSLFELALGIDRSTDLPLFAIIREAKTRTVAGAPLPSNPMLVHLGNWRVQDGFHVPWTIRVHRLDPAVDGRRFEERPAQDIFILEANLRPALTAAHFEPK